jgi:hypothetical protein
MPALLPASLFLLVSSKCSNTFGNVFASRNKDLLNEHFMWRSNLNCKSPRIYYNSSQKSSLRMN